MLQRVDTATLSEAARRDLASVLHRVEADVTQILALWPSSQVEASSAALARFGSSPGGKIVQTAGVPLRRTSRAGATDGRRVYAVGDVHGSYDLLIELLASLGRDAGLRAGPAPILILLGDYVDRGPDSARVLQALSLLKARAPFELCLLKGNHEEALLTFMDTPAGAAPWMAQGGGATLESYGVDAPVMGDPPQAYVAARDELLRRMPAAHLRLLQTLDLMAVVGDYAFVHAGVAPGEPLRKQSERDLLWIRREFLDTRGRFEKIIVHGHTWEDDEPVVTQARIGLDTGAYETGVLSAMRFEDGDRTVLRARDPTRPPWRKAGAQPPRTLAAAALDFTRADASLRVAPMIATDPSAVRISARV